MGDVVRVRSGRLWADVRVLADERRELLAHNHGAEVPAAEVREWVDELSADARGVAAGMDELGPWVDRIEGRA